jgi:hypothetical protein
MALLHDECMATPFSHHNQTITNYLPNLTHIKSIHECQEKWKGNESCDIYKVKTTKFCDLFCVMKFIQNQLKLVSFHIRYVSAQIFRVE